MARVTLDRRCLNIVSSTSVGDFRHLSDPILTNEAVRHRKIRVKVKRCAYRMPCHHKAGSFNIFALGSHDSTPVVLD
ncbi:hypothetical protein M513_06569 [Trichuris suis]|uniref:Uncharacterized protein n=1 Tax=Trichuris suis TaxID=68888 RepID=A0A085M5N9_9BILA|nr:hypothetical protein M513_06569 [Trichuris suis]